MVALAKTKKDLGNLLKYTGELLSINEKIVFDIAREPFPVFPEHAVSGLEGVDLAIDDETWMRIRRLRETAPPDCDPMFEGWADFGKHPHPDHPPKLISERMIRLSAEEVSELAEAELLSSLDDVMRPLEDNTTDFDVILRTTAMPEFCALWQAYLDGPWHWWAKVERPRRRSIDFYNKIYQIHQRILSMGDDTPIELVFGLGVARWRLGKERLNIPLIEQLIEVELEEDGTLFVRPRQSSPQLVLKSFHALEVEGSKGVQQNQGALFERIVDDPDRGFSPFDKSTFESVLRACSAGLSASGIYYPDELDDPNDRTVPNADDTLRITDTWVVFVRPRNEDFRKDDIRRIIQELDEIESEDELPAPGAKFVEEPSDEAPTYDDGTLIDLTGTGLTLPDRTTGWQGSTGGSRSGSGGYPAKVEETYFFPLPYNDEQIEVIRRLEEKGSKGVLVQGPPGTGKTHTIANVICHYLATNRRVLVTAKTPEALTALQEKIPEGIRDLTIAVIHNDREGARQLEHAVRILADEAKSINPRFVHDQIQEKQARIADLKAIFAKIDTHLYSFAERNLARLNYGGVEILPMELAREIASTREQHVWFDDRIDMSDKFQPQFSDDDVAEIRSLRQRHSDDLIYTVSDILDPALLPDLPRMLAAHGELARVNEIEGKSNAGELPFMSLDGGIDLDGAKKSRDWMRNFAAIVADLEPERWLFDIYHMLIGVKSSDHAATTAVKGALAKWLNLYGRGRDFSLKGLIIDEPDGDQAFDKAIDDLAAGKKPLGLFSFMKGGLKAKIDAVRLEGRAPGNSDDWAVVWEYRQWQRQVLLFVGQWGGVARAIAAPSFPSGWADVQSELLRLGRLVERIWAIHEEVDHHRSVLRKLFPYGLDVDEALHHGRCEKVYEALSANLEKAELVEARALRMETLALAGTNTLPFHTALRDLCNNLGEREVPQAAIAGAWRRIADEAGRLHSLKSPLSRLDLLVAKVAASGAPNWAGRLRTDALKGGIDQWTPVEWRKSWEWARADGYLRSLGDRETVRLLGEDRAKAELEMKKLFADVVRLRTFLGLKTRMTEKVESALARFGAAIARLGRGTGKSAGRFRRMIRDAAMDTAQAVPCWILPEWRVAEQLPPHLAAFDLVVIDEASQSDITALPAIMRGKKVLIVGDDKQVSPTPVGVEDRKIIQLRTTFLTGLPFADQMDPATSLYELGGMVYPGKAVMLREHFRCVEPIIRFSSQFYPTPLIPLRIPKASERLDPPLIDIYVPHGRKEKEINFAEVDIVVDEITKLVNDPAYEKRTIGVISLIGDKQAKLIYDRVVSDLGAEVIEKHKIMCGNSATFQGQERDIMVLSMVACPETATMQAQRIFEQRFNVAASRARDRLVLVRSVATSHLKEGDLKLRLIEHVRSPMEQGKTINPDDILAVCDSGFERDFGRCLLELGYRLKAQVPVAGRFIDFVVEGADDRRLAIELDGDKYHGPDRWAEDIRRQKALERLGWTFWRCWGSSWISDRQGCLDDLRATMKRMGIEPLGMAANDGVYTLHIVVPSPDAVHQGDDGSATYDQPRSEPVLASAPTISAKEPVLDQGLSAAPAVEPASQPVLAHEAGQQIEDTEFGDEVEVGDLIVIRYDDTPDRPIRFRLSKSENRPNEGIVHVQEPLGIAVLGASKDDAIEVSIGGGSRTAVIEQIEKGERQLRRPSFDDSPIQRPPSMASLPGQNLGGDAISQQDEKKVVLFEHNPHVTEQILADVMGKLHQRSDRYQEVDLIRAGFAPKPALIDEEIYEDTLVSMIRHVVGIEGPIREDILARRIAIDGHGFKRTGPAMKANIVRLARKSMRSTEEEVGLFFWPEDVNPDEWAMFRQPVGGAEPRTIEEISAQELRALVLTARKTAGRREDPWKVMARLAGVQRLRAPSRDRITQVSEGLLDIEIEGGETDSIELSTGCYLGDGAILEQNEEIYCHLHRHDLDRESPDGTAVARDGGLYVNGARVEPQRKNAWLQAALRIVQQQVGDISEMTGDAKSLNAWLCWFVRRDGTWIRLADLRTQVSKRSRGDASSDLFTEITIEDLDL